MRLYIDSSKLADIMLVATGVYENYRWSELPDGHLPVICLSKLPRLIVAVSEQYFIEAEAWAAKFQKRIYIVPINVIEELTGISGLADCWKEEEIYFQGFPPDLSNEDTLLGIYNNIDQSTKTALEANKAYENLINFDFTMENALGVFGRDSSVVCALNRFRDTMRFIIRHSPPTENWSDRYIDFNWASIISAVFCKGVEQKNKDANSDRLLFSKLAELIKSTTERKQ